MVVVLTAKLAEERRSRIRRLVYLFGSAGLASAGGRRSVVQSERSGYCCVSSQNGYHVPGWQNLLGPVGHRTLYAICGIYRTTSVTCSCRPAPARSPRPATAH